MRSLIVLFLLASCGPPKLECNTTAACGTLEACILGKCTEVDCLNNTDCELEQACSLETYTCEQGCSTSEDCFVGDRCDAINGFCVPRKCTDTQLDCDFGERCDLERGRCVDDPAPHCEPCLDEFSCGNTGLCASTIEGAFCFLECSPEAFDPCPSGLQCTRTSEERHLCVGFCGGL